MCQCGCSDVSIDRALEQGDKSVIGLQIYPGCGDCWAGLGVDLFFYPNRKSEWLKGVRIEKAPTPDEFGGNQGLGVAIPLFEIRDLQQSANSIEAHGGGIAQYSSLEDWLADFGLDLIQGALSESAERASRERRAK